MDLKLKITTLKSFPMFGNLQDADIKALAELAEIQDAKRGTFLITENTDSKEVFVVAEGRVDVCLTVPGQKKSEVIATLLPGEIFGELMLLRQGRRSASALAKDDVKILKWANAELLKLFEKNNRVGYVVMHQIARILADRLYSTNMGLRNALSQLS